MADQHPTSHEGVGSPPQPRHSDAACSDPLCSYRAEIGPLREQLEAAHDEQAAAVSREDFENCRAEAAEAKLVEVKEAGDWQMGKLAESETARHNTNLYWAKREKELEAELKQANERASDADTDWHACTDCLSEAKAEVEKMREQSDRNLKTSLYWGKQYEKAEADLKACRLAGDLAVAEVERLKRVAQSNLDFAWEAERQRDDAVQANLRAAARLAELAEVEKERDRLAESIASAMTSLATGPAKDGYAYDVLRAALEGKAE